MNRTIIVVPILFGILYGCASNPFARPRAAISQQEVTSVDGGAEMQQPQSAKNAVRKVAEGVAGTAIFIVSLPLCPLTLITLCYAQDKAEREGGILP